MALGESLSGREFVERRPDREPAAQAKGLSFDEAASVGVNYTAAWCETVEAAGLAAGETLLIIGAGGGVGGAAAQIAKRIGARVIGFDRQAPHPDATIRHLANRLIIGAPDLPAAAREATGGRGADVVRRLCIIQRVYAPRPRRAAARRNVRALKAMRADDGDRLATAG